MKFSILLFGMVQALRLTARLYPKFAERLKEQNFTAQFKLLDGSEGRWIRLENGRIKSKKGFCEKPEVTFWFKSGAIAVEFLTPPRTSRPGWTVRTSWASGCRKHC